MPVATSETIQKPRVLIVDDSRIVRATLVKHLENSFDAREANDGMEAWETLLIDPNIRVVMTDLTMPRLDGYGLLKRIRESKIARIRSIPVVVITGAQEDDEYARAAAAGATDLVSKGMTTSELLARMHILVGLEAMHHAFDRHFATHIKSAYGSNRAQLHQPEALQLQGQSMLAAVSEQADKFMLLVIRVGLQHQALAAYRALPSESVLDSVGQQLGWSVRLSDCVAQTGADEFTLITASVPVPGMHGFAGRVCRALVKKLPLEMSQMTFIASGGLASLVELPRRRELEPEQAFEQLRKLATRRATSGFFKSLNSIIGVDEDPQV